jgi:hypothetical protein
MNVLCECEIMCWNECMYSKIYKKWHHATKPLIFLNLPFCLQTILYSMQSSQWEPYAEVNFIENFKLGYWIAE